MLRKSFLNFCVICSLLVSVLCFGFQEVYAAENDNFVYSGVPSGSSTAQSNGITLDYSNADQGYVMVYATEPALKILISGPISEYGYYVSSDQWNTFPLPDGDGCYLIRVCRPEEDGRYSVQLRQEVEIALPDERMPFLYSNQYVPYENNEEARNLAARITLGAYSDREKITRIVSYVSSCLTYDYQQASSVGSDYTPDYEEILSSGEGICFDYSSLSAGMLRSVGIPCKLVFGYTEGQYHAWICAYAREEAAWISLDPTVDKKGEEIDPEKYEEMYFF